jgi:sulfate transport system permease protein
MTALRATAIAIVVLLVGAPLGALFVTAGSLGLSGFAAAVTAGAARDALVLSVSLSLLTTCVNTPLGAAIAWGLVRWDAPGRRLAGALVDLPLAVPTLVAGVLISALLGPQTAWGGVLGARGVDIVYAQPGIVLAMLFVTLPLSVRAVEPVVRELDPAEEEAAATLGAGRATTLLRVVLPPLLPSIGASAAQCFARALAEFGAIAAVSGNVPHRTLVGSVHVLAETEAGRRPQAAAAAVILLLAAAGLQAAASRWGRRR